MKKLLLLVFIVIPSIAFAVDTFNAQTGELYMPNVSLAGVPHEVTMVRTGDLDFQLTAVSPVTFPEEFSFAWLRTKTLYSVSHGLGHDSSGNEIDNVSVIEKLKFGEGYSVWVEGLLNSSQSREPEVAYSFSNGELYLNNDATLTNRIIGHTSTCLVTQSLNSGVVDNIDFYCFTEQEARELADILAFERSYQ